MIKSGKKFMKLLERCRKLEDRRPETEDGRPEKFELNRATRNRNPQPATIPSITIPLNNIVRAVNTKLAGAA